MRLLIIFVASLAIGAGAVYLARERADAPAPAIDVAAAPSRQQDPDEHAFAAPSAQPSPARENDSAKPQRSPRPPSRPFQRPSAPAPTPAEELQAKAERLTEREHFSREDIRERVERVLKGKLEDRELSAQDYDNLTDAIFQVRAAQRVISSLELSDESSDLLLREREKLMAAISEMVAITGIPTSQLGNVLTAEEADSDLPEEKPEEDTGDTMPEPVE